MTTEAHETDMAMVLRIARESILLRSTSGKESIRVQAIDEARRFDRYMERTLHECDDPDVLKIKKLRIKP
jgi:hypothetical protein